MKIRRYVLADYERVAELIKAHGLSLPTEQELSSYGLVCETEEEEKIIGFVWGLTHEQCATVFVDYFIVDKNHRTQKDKFGRGFIAVSLIMTLMQDMCQMGKTRVIGQLPHDDLSESLARIYHAVGMEFYKPFQFVQGNILEILTRMKEGQHGI